MKNLRLYINIPYCTNRCIFCDINNHLIDDDQREAFYKAIIKEIKSFDENYKYDYEVKSIYFGGGVPGSIRPNVIEEILSDIKEQFTISSDAEISLKILPGKLNDNYFPVYLDNGINRISIDYLTNSYFLHNFLGHKKTDNAMDRTLPVFLNHHFENVNFDLGIGLPGQNEANLDEEVHTLCDFHGAKEITLHPLRIEDNSGIKKLYDEHPEYLNNLNRFLPDIEKAYKYVKEKLEAREYIEYLPYCFGLKGFECLDYKLRKNNTEVIGIGPNAYSCIDGVTYSNTSDLNIYLENSDNFRLIATDIKTIQ
ncbi:radical SAM protein [Oribacterium sp. P6A1]|uniref:radical SAM protein n=1 Tax=Oribacterium sp. P6A1 TaxID=1410612 RepID=UPI000569CAC0|nr:radical SAM protein [Oribacterium sp. P6A1]